MALGPIELLVIGFPGNRFTGGILPEIERLVDSDVMTLVVALLIFKDDDGEVEFVELDQVDAGQGVAALCGFLDEGNGLISEEDMEGFAAALEPGSFAPALGFRAHVVQAASRRTC